MTSFILIIAGLALMIGQGINVLFIQQQQLNSSDILLISVLLTQFGTYIHGKNRKKESTM
jgi:hypothetical protein